MLAELVLNLLTPASRTVRALGLARESVGIWSRGRRRRSEWRPHEMRCGNAVRRAIAALPRRRRALVLGAGFLRDVPIEDMAAAFDEVTLVDVVHPLPARWRVRSLPNVKRIACDVSGALAWMTGEENGRGDPLARFRADERLDFVLSANLLSQLPIMPEEWLERFPSRAARLPERFADRFIGWHLGDLARFSCRVCLLTDVAMTERARDGAVLDRLDLMRGVALPPADESWDWIVAPFGEVERDSELVHRVHAYDDLARARRDCAPRASESA